MAELLSRLTSLSSHSHSSASCEEAQSHQINDLITFLRQPNNTSAITSSSEYLLDNLDPSRHSLAYLFVFHLHIQSIQKKTKSPLPSEVLPGGRLWLDAVHFLRHFDPVQIRHAGLEWRQLVEVVAQAAQVESKPLLAVLIIRDSILRLGISETLTSVHLLFVRMSLLTKTYTYALPILDRQVCHFPTPSNQGYQRYRHLAPCSEHEHDAALVPETSGFSAKLAYRDYLSYFLYGAMVYTVLKDWDKAIHWLGIVISSPVTGPVSKVMVEAYKKWLLVNLLGKGKLASPPSVVSSHVMRVYEALTKPYMSLAEAFEKCQFERLLREVEMGRSIWHTDNNTGLVSQLLSTFDNFIILKLGRTFSALKMSDVALQRFSTGELSPKQIETFVASLVMSGLVNAVLFHLRDNANSAMLRFASKGGQSLHWERNLRIRLKRESQLVKAIANGVDHGKSGLGFCNEYFQYLHRVQRGDDTPARVAYATEDGAGDQLNGDEDIMEDLH